MHAISTNSAGFADVERWGSGRPGPARLAPRPSAMADRGIGGGIRHRGLLRRIGGLSVRSLGGAAVS